MVTLPELNKIKYFLLFSGLLFLYGCSTSYEAIDSADSVFEDISATPVMTFTPIIEVVEPFDGERAWLDVAAQLEFGPRHVGTEGHEKIRQWIKDSLAEANWQVELVEGTYKGTQIQNIVATRGDFDPELPWVTFGAHYDTRKYADQDPDPALRQEPVMGANDGASGVAVLLEMARTIPQDLDVNISLVFFDAEDNGGIDDWEWIVGSQLYVEALTQYPDKFILVDMVGDVDQNILFEQSSDLLLAGEVWDVARQLGIDTFIFEQRGPIIDDHTPFLRQGVSAIDIIDFEYPFWHTTHDTLDKVSAESLQNVGLVLIEWLKQNYEN